MTVSAALSGSLRAAFAISMMAAAILPTTPVVAGDTVLEPITRCITHPKKVAKFYRWKNPDDVRVKDIGGSVFEVIVTKDGKKGKYHFDGCTQQSTKIS